MNITTNATTWSRKARITNTVYTLLVGFTTIASPAMRLMIQLLGTGHCRRQLPERLSDDHPTAAATLDVRNDLAVDGDFVDTRPAQDADRLVGLDLGDVDVAEELLPAAPAEHPQPHALGHRVGRADRDGRVGPAGDHALLADDAVDVHVP